MTDNLNSVKMGQSYHHGNLRQSLLDSAINLISEKGVEGFSLRETARRAGVSPAAPKHHFADSRALLTALATSAFTDLASALEQANIDAPPDNALRLQAQGTAYIRFALGAPALFGLMWRSARLDMEDAALLTAKQRAFVALDHVVRGEDAEQVTLEDPAMDRTMAHWALVHGLAGLALDNLFGDESNRKQVLDAVTPRLVALIAAR